MKRFTLHTMGCKSNQYEGSIIKNSLEKNGFMSDDNLVKSDIYILNSCSVTHKSDNEALYLIRNAKHKNPKILTVLTGCFAQIEKENLLKDDCIDVVVGNNEKLFLGEFLKEYFMNPTSSNNILMSDIMERNEFTYTPIADISKTRASLKIQDGCNNRCSYCIIPFARGNSRSAASEFIIDQVNTLVEYGFKEVVLTGIHIGLWGKEFNLTLLDLLKDIENKTNISRYRLGSLYPNEIDDSLLNFLKKSDRFCPHFHLSLQSACNKTLKSMNRHYKVEDYLYLIDKINNIFENPFIGSDIIVGFAGESEKDFDITYSNLQNSGLSQIHTFPYSVRRGTVGADMSEQVEDSVKTLRADKVKLLSKKKYSKFVEKNIGSVKKLLVEKHPDKQSGFLKGVSDNYLTVMLNTKDESYCNTFVNARLTEYSSGILYGEII